MNPYLYWLLVRSLPWPFHQISFCVWYYISPGRYSILNTIYKSRKVSFSIRIPGDWFPIHRYRKGSFTIRNTGDWFPIHKYRKGSFSIRNPWGWFLIQGSRDSWFTIRNPGMVYFQKEIQVLLIYNKKSRDNLFQSREGWFSIRNQGRVDFHP